MSGSGNARVRQLVETIGPARVAREITGALLPSARITTTSAPHPTPTGTSRIGGAPDLPDEREWPHWQGRPLSFLAQIALTAVRPLAAGTLLPPDGLLLFFYDAEEQPWGFDPAHRGAARVLHVDGAPGGPLQRISDPADRSHHTVFPECAVSCAAELTLPPEESLFVQGLNLTPTEREQYRRLQDYFRQQGRDLRTTHRLVGHPDLIQGEMQSECQLASNGISCGDGTWRAHPRAAELAPGAAEWLLLLQIDSDDEAGMTWGDTGRLYFWIRRGDLAARRFDMVWAVLQCY